MIDGLQPRLSYPILVLELSIDKGLNLGHLTRPRRHLTFTTGTLPACNTPFNLPCLLSLALKPLLHRQLLALAHRIKPSSQVRVQSMHLRHIFQLLLVVTTALFLIHLTPSTQSVPAHGICCPVVIAPTIFAFLLDPSRLPGQPGFSHLISALLRQILLQWDITDTFQCDIKIIWLAVC